MPQRKGIRFRGTTASHTRIKPARWTVHPDLVDPSWRWAYRDCVLYAPLLHERREVVTRKHGHVLSVGDKLTGLDRFGATPRGSGWVVDAQQELYLGWGGSVEHGALDEWYVPPAPQTWAVRVHVNHHPDVGVAFPAMAALTRSAGLGSEFPWIMRGASFIPNFFQFVMQVGAGAAVYNLFHSSLNWPAGGDDVFLFYRHSDLTASLTINGLTLHTAAQVVPPPITAFKVLEQVQIGGYAGGVLPNILGDYHSITIWHNPTWGDTQSGLGYDQHLYALTTDPFGMCRPARPFVPNRPEPRILFDPRERDRDFPGAPRVREFDPRERERDFPGEPRPREFPPRKRERDFPGTS